MLKFKNIILLLVSSFFLVACGADRADSDTAEALKKNGVLGVVLTSETDRDGDGVSNDDEVNIYGTNPDNNDTDGDGLLDGEEINVYDTNATNADSDGDGLNDGDEINTYDTNATNSDTDNDGLSDGDEINTYDTNATNADSDGDRLSDGDEINIYDTNATNPDTDSDGLSDGAEINTYDTNPDNNDTDSDGLLDGEEINTYDTNATNPDTDNDGLTDGLEVNTYSTNPKNSDGDSDGLTDGVEINTYGTNPANSDTDGDCLLDSFEVLDYNTSATNVDTDGDKVNDGIEIYSYNVNDLNVTCLASPETLNGGANATPAKDNIPTDGTDVINALDPTNDSDGDGQANSKENNCTEGDPLDASKLCPYETNSTRGEILNELGYVYVPGGFDVDGDGVNEGGFWMSEYQARKSGTDIPSEIVSELIGNVNKYISKNFKVVNKDIVETSYADKILGEDQVTALKELSLRAENAVEWNTRIVDYNPLFALAALSKLEAKDTDLNAVDINFTMPTHKQYVQVKMLLDADRVGGGDGTQVKNSVLGVDVNVPLYDYQINIREFGTQYREFVKNIIQLRDTTDELTFDSSDLNKSENAWWGIDNAKYEYYLSGYAYSTIDLKYGTGEVDPYAVMVRGGDILDIKQGITATSSANGGIGFRAATDYLY